MSLDWKFRLCCAYDATVSEKEYINAYAVLLHYKIA